MPACKNCQSTFTIYPEDRAFYGRIGVPEPTWCPPCREMRRWAYRNTKTLYPRKCDLCQKDIISVYPAGSSYTVYCPDCWYSDKWDDRAFGRDFDFNQPFFSQFAELQKAVPRMSNYNRNSVNCDYCNAAVESKNCYLLFSCRAEDCYYGYKVIDSRDCVDNLGINNCELCYQSVDCIRCFNVAFSRYTYDSRDSAFLYNCSNCHDCFLSANLKNQEYCFLNQRLSPAEYEKKIADWRSGSYLATQKYLAEFAKLKSNTFHRYAEIQGSTNCSGDNIHNSKNCFHCFDLGGGNGDRYFSDSSLHTSDCMDSIVGSIDNELIYENLSTITGYQILFGTYCWSANFLHYCDQMLGGGSYCFGCVGLKKGKYAIFNKQYTESEYRKLSGKIIEHMKKTGEWGEFFPVELSPFAYNETSAIDEFPLTKEEVLQKGWRWKDDLPGVFGKETLTPKDLPDKISEVDDKILEEVLACVDCGRNYKIVKAELKFYQKQSLPLPRQCFDCRYLGRLKQRNPHRLWRRQCMCENAEHNHQNRCSNEFETSYAPDRPEKVYCEECYRKEIY
ncbi:MAG: hypothetical protein WCT37_01190 [Patescibacteria group bacterium]|jgi:hypothetical protein